MALKSFVQPVIDGAKWTFVVQKRPKIASKYMAPFKKTLIKLFGKQKKKEKKKEGKVSIRWNVYDGRQDGR
jgi:hypothetical protein